MIKIENFTFYYADAMRPALSDINLEIEDGEFVLITGPSGSGKSSLCRCFNGLVPHFYGGKVAGRAEVQGLDILKHSTREMAARVGMIFQDPENQIVNTSVEREIAFGLENLRYPLNLMSRRIEESLDTMGISALRNRPIAELSGGEKQKVAIASVLALHPEILVLDEPTSELDPQSAEDVLSIIKRLNDELGITVILIEHRLERVLPYADRLIVLDQGRVAVDGGVRNALSSSYKKILAAGVGVPPVTRLGHRLRSTGLDGNDLPLTVKEGRLLLREYLKEAHFKPLQQRKEKQGKAVIRTEKLGYVYPEGPVALRDVNLEIKSGEFVAIMGRNASGKSTLIRHFNGLLKPTRGRVLVDGVETRKKTTAELAGKIGLILQNPNDHLFADSVEDEIHFALNNLGFNRQEIGARTDRAIKRFGLAEFRRRYPRSMSGGEKQRVALASVIAVEPQVLILDEPTRGMEQQLKSELMDYLDEYAQEGHSVVLVTHDVETAAEHVQRVILMSEGEIVVDGGKHEVLSKALLFSPQINRLVQPFEKYRLPADILTLDELMQVIG